MATFFINSSNETTIGTPDADQFFIESGVQRINLQGESGTDEFQYFFGGVNSSYNFGNSNVNGNGGNDTIRLKLNTGSDILANAFRGGQGNDSIVVTAASASGSLLAGNLFQGGQGNDTLKVKVQSADYNDLTLNGNEGTDFLIFSATANVGNRVNNINLLGGQGFDQIVVNLNSTGQQNINVAGGLGSDRLQIQIENTAENLVVNGGTLGTEASDDVGDEIFVSAENFIGRNSIIGNGGDDTMFIDSDSATNVLFAGNAGNDTLTFSAGDFRNVTMGGGNGDDVIEVRQSAGAFSGGRNSLIGGNGDDTIFIRSANNLSGATVTIQGGAGADLFFNGISADADPSARDNISGGNFSYVSLTDSTIDALDTIVVGSGNSTAVNLNLFMPASVPVTVFNGQAGGFQFSAGILEMDTAAGSGGRISLSQIVGALDTTLAEGDAVAFRLNTSTTAGFVFVAGAQAGVNDDLLIQIEGISSDQMSAGNSTLTNGGNNSVILATD